MFSGIGGFEYGISQVNGAECVGFSEIDRYAISVYQRHFPNHPNFGDATKLIPESIPDFDLLVGGFPCQAFSVAGKRHGFADTRGTLFFEIARVLDVKRPRYFVLENVKGLLSHDSGKTLETILGTIHELGYECQWQVLNSRWYVPQNRERIYLVGHLRGTPRPEVFPIGETSGEDYIDTEIDPGRSKILSHYGHTNKEAVESDVAPTLKAQSHGHEPMVSRQPLRYLDRNQKNVDGDHAFTVDASQTSGVKVDTQIRRLTPVECERLQGFPDGWTALDKDSNPISDTQRYKMCGNAVTTNVVTAVMERLLCKV